jgi:hypothetical protein
MNLIGHIKGRAAQILAQSDFYDFFDSRFQTLSIFTVNLPRQKACGLFYKKHVTS